MCIDTKPIEPFKAIMYYDKYSISTDDKGKETFCHSYSNKYTVDLTPDNIGEYECMTGIEAIDFYNNNEHPNKYPIPEFVKDDPLFNVRVYYFETNDINVHKNPINVVIALVDINFDLLEKYVESKRLNKYPPIKRNTELREFIQTIIRFDYLYKTDFDKMSDNTSIADTHSQNINSLINIIMKGVDYTLDAKVNQLPEIKLKLFDYQRASIQWMADIENNKNPIYYNKNDETKLGEIYYDYYTKQFNTQTQRDRIIFKGGGLIDEVGLGKTIQMIALTLKNKSLFKPYTCSEIPNKFISTATLVLCPNQLCGQWLREIKGKLHTNPKIIDLRTKLHHDKHTYKDYLDADYIIASFQVMDNATMTKQWCPMLDFEKRTSHKSTWDSNHFVAASLLFDTLGSELMKDKFASLQIKNPLLQLIHWNRIVVDEIHEVYKDGAYTHIFNTLPFLTADNKWFLSATPFTMESNLMHLVNYVTDYAIPKASNYVDLDDELRTNRSYIPHSFIAGEEVSNYLANKCFRRNTKETIKHEYTLPSIIEEVRMLTFTQTERMMYNAHLMNHNHTKFDVFLRQLCCHPQLADETKASLQNCKTLKDIEKTMLDHYRNTMNGSKHQCDTTNRRINKINRMIAVKNGKLIQPHSQSHRLIDLDGMMMDDLNTFDDDEYFTDEDTGERVKVNLENISITTLENRLNKQRLKLGTQQKVLAGHTSTFNFYNNVIERIKKTASKEKSTDANEEETCGICMDDIKEEDIGVTKCGHLFCYECIRTWILKAHNCPHCKQTLKDSEVYSVSFELKKPVSAPVDKQKETLVNEYGTKLANLILYLKNTKEHVIIFSQWHELLCKVGNILNNNKIGNLFCKGNCYQRDKAIKEFNDNDKIRVIMLSSDSMAAGTNLTKASVVIFLDPIYGKYKYRKEQEKQAIGRAHRMGQQSVIKIIRFIIKDSIENDIYKINVEEDNNNKDYFKKTEVDVE